MLLLFLLQKAWLTSLDPGDDEHDNDADDADGHPLFRSLLLSFIVMLLYGVELENPLSLAWQFLAILGNINVNLLKTTMVHGNVKLPSHLCLSFTSSPIHPLFCIYSSSVWNLGPSHHLARCSTRHPTAHLLQATTYPAPGLLLVRLASSIFELFFLNFIMYNSTFREAYLFYARA